MKIYQVSQQNFNGKLQVLGELGEKQSKALEEMKPVIEDLIEKQNFDLFVKRTSFGETIVGTDINNGHVVNSDNNFIRSALLAIRDKTKESYFKRKINMLKNTISDII